MSVFGNPGVYGCTRQQRDFQLLWWSHTRCWRSARCYPARMCI